MTGAQVMAMAADVPALKNMRPGGKEHPVDRVLHDGESVTVGGTTLVAHLTPGHSRGNTTWTLQAEDGGRKYDVVIVGSLGVDPGFKLVNNTDVPGMADEYRRAFKVVRSCRATFRSHLTARCTTWPKNIQRSRAERIHSSIQQGTKPKSI